MGVLQVAYAGMNPLLRYALLIPLSMQVLSQAMDACMTEISPMDRDGVVVNCSANGREGFHEILIGSLPDKLPGNCGCGAPPYLLHQEVVYGKMVRRRGTISSDENEGNGNVTTNETAVDPAYVNATAYETAAGMPYVDAIINETLGEMTYVEFHVSVAVPSNSCCCFGDFMQCRWKCNDVLKQYGFESANCTGQLSVKNSDARLVTSIANSIIIDTVLFSCVIACFAAGLYFERSRRAAIYHAVPRSDNGRDIRSNV